MSLFGWKDFQSTEESSEKNRLHLCADSVGIYGVPLRTKSSKRVHINRTVQK